MTDIEDIYNRYFKDVYHFVYRLSKDPYVAEDVTSDTFMKAMKGLKGFDQRCDIRVWLFQIAKNTYISYLRKNKKEIPETMTTELKSDFDLERHVTRTEDLQKIQEIIHAVKEPHREVFKLRAFGEMSFKEIGKLMGKTDNWACVTYYRAKKKIVEEWSAYDKD